MSPKISTLITTTLLLLAKSECDTSARGQCFNKPEALRLKLIAIAGILVASMIGVCLPLFSRSVPALRPGANIFVLVKAFASGVILATGYMHVLPDSFDDLHSPCLPENPWRKFPFTTFAAMLSALVTLMIDSLMMARFNIRHSCGPASAVDHESQKSKERVAANGGGKDLAQDPTIARHRIVAQVLEMGIVVHSVVIGLSMGASQSPCTIRPLVAALCFHQLFEGMGLGGCIVQAEYGLKMKSILAFFFATTTPFGIALGIALTNVYSDSSPTALIVEGLLNACSAGLLNYMALVDLLAADFMGPKLQSSIGLQLWSFAAVLFGAGGMSLMAKWA
ncbi:fe(2+) transport protein 1-like isoform X2 [Asparagus officinalis]|uniref:fe(2+) transport protein 1-like isoform X2 n=1 Tax=Asparagus officinalis TaxID=4686 RepID=UPI00098DF51E|nr:fe(2+) transport protein 1-like isoform X2 [Asparagus officinalis]